MAGAIVHPGKKVVATVGDGGFLYSSMELETAVRLKLDMTSSFSETADTTWSPFSSGYFTAASQALSSATRISEVRREYGSRRHEGRQA